MSLQRTTLLSLAVLLSLSLTSSADSSGKQLQESSNCWNRNRQHFAVHMTRVSHNRKLASVGDTIYVLDARNRILWTWSSQGPPLTDHPIVDSRGTVYAIGFDLIWIALDATTGKLKWRSTANGRAVYSQIGWYKHDLYYVVTSMEGYRDSLSDSTLKDRLSLCRGNSILWETGIPPGSRIEIQGSKVIAVLKRKRRSLRNLVMVPHRFGAPIGKVST